MCDSGLYVTVDGPFSELFCQQDGISGAVSVWCYVRKVLCRRSCVSYATPVSRHRTRNIPSPSATGQALRAARPKGPSSRLTVALPPREMFADRLYEFWAKIAQAVLSTANGTQRA